MPKLAPSRPLLHAALLGAASVALLACDSSTTVLEPDERGSGGAGGAGGAADPSSGSDTGDGGGAGAATPCASNAECTDEGSPPQLCLEGRCEPLLSAVCPTLLGDPSALREAEAPRLLGVLAPLSGPHAALGTAESQMVALALDELRATQGGVPEGAERRAVFGILCDEAESADASAHLVAVGARAVVGPSEPGHLIEAATPALDAGTTWISPRADDPEAIDLADEGRVWQASPSVAANGPALAATLARVEASLGASPLRVAIAGTDDARASAVRDALLGALVLNGAGADDNVADGNLVVFTAGADPSETAAAILDADVDVVVVVSPALLDGIVGAVDGAAADPPTWIAGPLPDDVQGPLSGAPLAGRAFGVRVGLPASPAAFAELSIRYATAFGAPPPEDAAPAYDAAYALIDVMAAAGVDDGAVYAASVSRLVPPGIPTPVGPSSLSQAFSSLASGAAIDLVGASGDLDFDLVTGAAPRVHHVLCNDGGEMVESGLVHEPGAHALVGDSSCL